MATKQRPKKTSRSASKKPTRSAAARGKKTAAKSRTTPAKKRSQASRRAVGSVMSRHSADLWGVGAIVIGLLVAASVWLGVAGVVGETIDDVLALGIGLVRLVLPVGLVAAGVVMVRGHESLDDSAERIASAVMGGFLLTVSTAGLLHVARGLPGIDDPIARLGAAGGLLGMGVGGPLQAFAATTGAVLVLAAVAFVGLIVLTRSSARNVGLIAMALSKTAGAAAASAFRGLFGDPSVGADDPAIDLDAGLGPEQASADFGSQSDATDDVPASVQTPSPTTPARRPVERVEPASETEQQALPLAARSKGSKWKLPPASLLSRTETQSVDRALVVERGRLLQATLAQFGVETTLLAPVIGPTVTRFVLELGEGVKVSKLESLRKDIAYAMASPDVRILAPIPGRRAIGVEVPNTNRQIVAVGDILASREARAARHPLEVAIGRDINGRNVMINLATMPHVLIAGATGAGKSSCLNSILTSILMRSTPDEVRMILVDPKRVEMGQYEQAPHLLTAPVTDPRKAANALAWAVREMDRRYNLLSKVGFRDITGYNNAIDQDALHAGLGEVDEFGEPLVYKRLPFILVVVDELAEMMMVAARDVEDSIARIAQMARAVGIHLVIATQRPSVNVITGVIKANVPARLAFAVSSLTDSRVILDQPGAERLVGKGDLLLLGPASSSPHRIQGCWVEEEEVRAIVKFWRDQAPDFAEDHEVASEAPPPGDGQYGAGPSAAPVELAPSITDSPPPSLRDDGDEFLGQAMDLVVQTQLGSTSMLQRKLRVGFARAGRIMDLLEQQGIVGPSTGSKARDVLITPEELAARRAQG